MRTEVIEARTVDEAAERVLQELKEDAAATARSSSRRNVIYFDGWDGLGASAVLREVGRRLTPAASQEDEPTPAGRRAPAVVASPEFSQIIHIDCSKWESRRALQRALAEQLELPAAVMKMLDTQDEEDDYNGVAQGSRVEMPRVAGAMYQHVQKLNRRFLVIFHNGSSEEIDLDSLGFPLAGYSRNKVLWSFQGRFRLYPRTKVDRALKSTGTTDVVLSAASSYSYTSYLLDQEATDVASKINIGGIHWSAAATNCFLYTVKLYDMGSRLVDYDLATHVCNYWICDDIIELIKQGDVGTDEGVDRLWLPYDALQREMRMDADFYQNPCLPSPLARDLPDHIAYWTSPTYGFMLIPSRIGRIPKGMFQHLDKICVLKLSACIFSFTSPPFLCCHSLRFLWLEYCRHVRSTDGGVGKEEDIRRCFQRLWVLDVRYSIGADALLSAKMIDFMTQLRELNVMGQIYLEMDPLQGRLNNIRRFRVTKSIPICGTDPGKLFSGMGKLELLDFSGNDATVMYGSPVLSVGSSCSSLETVIIDGSNNLKSISLTGCVKLRNLFLSGLFPNLYSLDLTGSAVKTLDLSAVTAPNLDKLFLLDCGKLCAILWPPEDKRKRYLDKLRVDTTQEEGTAAGDHGTGRSPPPTGFNWYISVRDARLLGSLVPVKEYFGPHCTHVEISTIPSSTRAPAATTVAGSKDEVQVNLQQQMLKDNAIYADISATLNALYEKGDYDALVIKCCTCPPAPCLPSQDCYMHIEDQMKAGLQDASISIPGFVCDSAKILHVHDSSFITRILAAPLVSTTWDQLEWCRIEGCPKLECVISSENGAGPGGIGRDTDMFKKLRTIWASHLPNTRYIWSWSVSARRWDTAFVGLTLLHLDYCPRLIYVTDLGEMAGLESLETLEIMWCGDLSTVFKGSANWRLFPNLKHIHLHELPKLQDICDIGSNMHVSNLETIKIRGCWSLKRLPYCGENVVECNCEKEWWDRLEWDSFMEPSQYKPTHPRHYKKTMLRGSVLR
uniref:Disease resistance protein At4g27190-like leucine-rich repeats domain-containing protein n=1 Tax=Arundo donax TaxID=35708 RepID=A0A0A8YZU2_ARUDO